MGRTRGGLTTKIHLLVDACGLPILLKITEGQAHDGRSAQDMLGTVGRGDVLVADRAYDSNALRDTLAARGARANVRAMPNRLKPPRFNKRLYRKRNLVERSSTNSGISAPSQLDTTNATIIISPQSNSRQFESGCALMSRQPSRLLKKSSKAWQ
jgi:transposase